MRKHFKTNIKSQEYLQRSACELSTAYCIFSISPTTSFCTSCVRALVFETDVSASHFCILSAANHNVLIILQMLKNNFNLYKYTKWPILKAHIAETVSTQLLPGFISVNNCGCTHKTNTLRSRLCPT